MSTKPKKSYLQFQTMVVNKSFSKLKENIENLPSTFDEQGITLYHKRNIIKKMQWNGVEVVVKSFKRPNWINRIIYGCLRGSKASRSYKYSKKLQKLGIGVPQPIAYLQFRKFGLFDQSYFISQFSECRFIYNSLYKQPKKQKELILSAIGEMVAKMHDNKIFHRDLSGGNILFDFKGEKVEIELLDLNRMNFGPVSMTMGCKNFERLDATPEELVIMANAYAKARNLNAQKCINKILIFNYKYHR